MLIKKLGNDFYQLVHDYGSSVGRIRPKTPPNQARVLFQYQSKTDDIMIVRGSLMMSKAEIRTALVGL